MSDEVDIIRSWLNKVLVLKCMKPTPLAKAVGLSPSTLLRALDSSRDSALDLRSIMKISNALSVPPPEFVAVSRSDFDCRKASHVEPEVVKIASSASGECLFLGLRLRAQHSVWLIRSQALTLAGYLPGDELLVDGTVQAVALDVVIAEIKQRVAGEPAVALRIYDKPFLITDTQYPEARRKPELVDEDRTRIIGVAVKSLRNRPR